MAPGATPKKPLIRWVTKDLSDGWVAVRLDSGGRVSLPSYLKVAVYKEEPGRSYFTILEGVNKGRKASVGQLKGKSVLVDAVVPSPGATVRLNRDQQRLWYGTKGPFFAFSGAFTGAKVWTAVPRGTYTLQIPDFPHPSNRYSAYTPYQTTWFLILGKGVATENGRYLHLGELSEGCVTVRAFVFDPKAPSQSPGFEDWAHLPDTMLGGWGYPYPKGPLAPLASWNNIYAYLINSRLNDQAVGTLVVE